MLQERKKRQMPKGEQRTIRLYDGEYCSRKCSLYSVDQKDRRWCRSKQKRDSPYRYISGRGYLDYDQWFWQRSK
jgi:hypothetical protein